LEEEVYHDRDFRGALTDAIESLTVGSAWELKSKLGPLIRPPIGDLQRGLNQLEPGESWGIVPRPMHDNPCLISPGLKWDIPQGGFTHLTELFGPLLGAMPYQHLHQAIHIVHRTGYGLTSGLESLDDREQTLWTQQMRAGNLYINRPTTGAIVLRQPFGGMGKSAFGPGIKAGGPNYVVPLMQYATLADVPSVNVPMANVRPTENSSTENSSTENSSTEAPELEALSVFYQQLHMTHNRSAAKLREHLSDDQWRTLLHLIVDYDAFAIRELRSTHDTLRLLGQDNLRRYLPMRHLRLRVEPTDSWLDMAARAVAVVAVGGRATLSHAAGVHPRAIDVFEALTQEWAGDLEFLEESDEELAAAILAGQVDRVRYAGTGPVPAVVRKAATEHLVYVADRPISPCGRIELLWYVQEQSVCVDYHRYGNLGFRVHESRCNVL